ncbi:MAG: GIY-YIG nuclease family protein [Bdellovibrionales bacterium]
MSLKLEAFPKRVGLSKKDRLALFKQLYDEQNQHVRKTIYWMVGPECTDDLVQETFLKAWKNFFGFKGKSSPMYIYILQSKADPTKLYTGKTSNPKRRLHQHNSGQSNHTRKYMPWKYRVLVWLGDPTKSHRLEKYLKSGFGIAFTNRHF